jgi:hypothetical protein
MDVEEDHKETQEKHDPDSKAASDRMAGPEGAQRAADEKRRRAEGFERAAESKGEEDTTTAETHNQWAERWRDEADDLEKEA